GRLDNLPFIFSGAVARGLSVCAPELAPAHAARANHRPSRAFGRGPSAAADYSGRFLETGGQRESNLANSEPVDRLHRPALFRALLDWSVDAALVQPHSSRAFALPALRVIQCGL